MPTYPTLTKGNKNPAVKILRAVLVSQGYKFDNVPDSQEFDSALAGAVIVFQAQHRDADGMQLRTDGVVGPKTWYAIQNPSGKAQGGTLKPSLAGKMLTGPSGNRAKVLQTAYAYLKAGTKEIPDGSNWGGKVSEILKHHGHPDPWCLLFVSECFRQGTGAYPFGDDQAWVYGFWQAAKKRGCAHPIGDGYTPRPGDIGVIIYPGPKKEGHVFFVAAVEKGTAIGYRFNHIGGNEGNAVRFGLRKTWDNNFQGFVNLYGDDAAPYIPAGLVTDLGEVLGESGKATR